MLIYENACAPDSLSSKFPEVRRAEYSLALAMALQKEKKLLALLGNAYRELRKNDPLRLAGATAFFTTFALPAVLIILIRVFGIIVSTRVMARRLLQNLSEIIGNNTASDLHRTLVNVHRLPGNRWISVATFLFLIFVATTLFKVIKDSLNQLWNIKVEDHAGFAFRLLDRVKSFVVILVAGMLFMGVLLGEGVIHFLKHSLTDQSQSDSLILNGFIKQIISIIVVTAWFTSVFKFLPDGRPSWRVAIAGAFFTALLFTLGKWLIIWLLSLSNMQDIYGASASSVLLLLFVFYSSFIFYYGACFTKVWADAHQSPISPGRHASLNV